jgi:hypothetical protein
VREILIFIGVQVVKFQIQCFFYLLIFSVPLQVNAASADDFDISLDDLYNYQIDGAQRRADRLNKMATSYDRKVKRVQSGCNSKVKLSYESKVKFSNKFVTGLNDVYISRFRRGDGYCEVHIAYSSGVCITRAEDIVKNTVSLGNYINCEN